VLLALCGNRLLGRPVGWVAALFLLFTPAFAFQLTKPSVEATELSFIFGGFLATLKWKDARRSQWAFLAGLLFSLATQVRETAFLAAPFALAYLYLSGIKPKLQHFAAAIAGFATPLLVEFAVYAVAAGDPLYRMRLGVAHTQIPSSELLGPIDRTHAPFFNKAYISNWAIQPGIHVHWAIDGLLNLFVNGSAGVSLPLVTLFVLFGRKRLGPKVSRQALLLLLAGLAYMACLIYGFAIDPKPRMMLVGLSLTSLALALTTLRLRAAGFPLLAFSIWGAVAFLGISLQYAFSRPEMIEEATREWLAERRGQIEIEDITRRNLALVPAADALPGLDANKKYLLLSSWMDCDEWISVSGLPANSLSVVESVKSSRIKIKRIGGEFCLLRYDRPVSAGEITSALLRTENAAKANRQTAPIIPW